jgi:hypothetical protein
MMDSVERWALLQPPWYGQCHAAAATLAPYCYAGDLPSQQEPQSEFNQARTTPSWIHSTGRVVPHLWCEVLFSPHKAVGTCNRLSQQQQLVTIWRMACGWTRVLYTQQYTEHMSA